MADTEMLEWHSVLGLKLIEGLPALGLVAMDWDVKVYCRVFQGENTVSHVFDLVQSENVFDDGHAAFCWLLFQVRSIRQEVALVAGGLVHFLIWDQVAQ